VLVAHNLRTLMRVEAAKQLGIFYLLMIYPTNSIGENLRLKSQDLPFAGRHRRFLFPAH
jgi:hypothetical protein